MTAAVRSDGAPSARPELWRIGDRATFQALRGGRRVRRGSLSVTYLAPSLTAEPRPPRAAFAIGTAVGGAVVRNRIRRRLRSALRELQRRDGLPAGDYLLSGRTDLARLPWSELVSDLEAAIGAVTEERAS